MKRTILIVIALAAVAVLDVYLFGLARDRFADTEYRVYRPEDIRCRTEGFPRTGPEDAAVTIVEYADFECRYSAEMDRVLDTLLERFGPETIAIYYKPRPIHKTPFRRLRVRAAYAAHRQGKFFEMKRALTAMELSEDEAAREEKLRGDIRAAAETIGLDVARLERDLESPAVDEVVREVVAETEKYGIYSYPSVFINGHFVKGVRPSGYYIERIAAMVPDSLVTEYGKEEA